VLQRSPPPERPHATLEALRKLCIDAGAADAGIVSIDRAEVDADRDDILAAMPKARTLLSFVVSMNPASVQSPARSIANVEFHHAGDETNEISRRIIEALHAFGARGINPAMGFPMEMQRFPGKIWVVSHKLIAEAAGLGRMGIHRNLIHPRLGNFVLLGTVITDLEVAAEQESQPIDFNPCLECKLCVAACPVGAIKPEGAFDFSACYVHNYREFMGGFTDWVEQVVESKDRADYRKKVGDAESASVWQSLSFGANYKAAYCMAVCPAGEDVLAPYLDSKKAWKQDVLDPLVRKEETLYVLRNSDARDHAQRRFPHKPTKVVHSNIRPTSVWGFFQGAPLSFQRGRAKDVPRTTYHFEFTGREKATMTFVVDGAAGTLETSRELVGEPDLHVVADSQTWLQFLAGERSPVWAIITRKFRLRGSVALLQQFGRCFAS
ncbi:MAG: SCP2 sterol-binding domain-containing protein, partial [Nannocystaceae bacterium]|nr:SCP2 sterol-binding domain-containing protein [Nannocystaceae bacterium]